MNSPTRTNDVFVTFYVQANAHDPDVLEFYASDPEPFGARLMWTVHVDDLAMAMGEPEVHNLRDHLDDHQTAHLVFVQVLSKRG
jgi:hypothetical protein